MASLSCNTACSTGRGCLIKAVSMHLQCGDNRTCTRLPASHSTTRNSSRLDHKLCSFSFDQPFLQSSLRHRFWPSSPPLACPSSGQKFSCRAAGNGGESKPEYSKDARARAEVLSPFRTVRQFFYIAFMASGGLGSLITLSKVAASFSGIDNGVPLSSTLKDLGIDVLAVLIFAFLYSQDAKAKDAQLARLGREESLGQLRLELANKRTVSASSLRGKARLVILAGPPSHVEAALESAKPFKDQLVERGCLVVPLITEEAKGADSSRSTSAASEPVAESSGALPDEYKVNINTERRWKASPLYTNEWRKWLEQQMAMAKVGAGTPVYISLRLDGRVRASGLGTPPWPIIVAQLGPLTGSSFMDGFDGSV